MSSAKNEPRVPVTGTLATDITDTTKTTVISAGSGTTRTYLTSCVVTNSHDSVSTVVKIYSGTTLKFRLNASYGSGFTIPIDEPIEGGQAEAWSAQPETSGAAIQVAMAGYQYRK